MKNIIEFENVSKSFGDLKVLNKLNLEVKDGEKLALVGPSGSGKTTILRILMTLETIDKGFVTVSDEFLIQSLFKPFDSLPTTTAQGLLKVALFSGIGLLVSAPEIILILFFISKFIIFFESDINIGILKTPPRLDLITLG